MYLLNGGAPFTKDTKTGRVRDRTGEEVTLYPAAREALLELATSKEWQGSLVCYASRCHETDWAHTCMDLLDVGDGLNVASCFNAGGVFQSGSKQGHFQVLASQHGVDFEDMIFFDNERWNITEVAKMGVTWYVLSLSLSLFGSVHIVSDFPSTHPFVAACTPQTGSRRASSRRACRTTQAGSELFSSSWFAGGPDEATKAIGYFFVLYQTLIHPIKK